MSANPPVWKEAVKKESPVATVAAVKEPEDTQSISVISELDSYVRERMKSQPRTIDEAVAKTAVFDSARPRHRLELPDYFFNLSGDNREKPGPYIFRWIWKEKRAIDKAINSQGWFLVNRTYFPDAPRYLFTASGGVEVGDAILGFMPTARAMDIRKSPGKISRERIQSQMTQVSGDEVIMTGNPQDPKVYKPQLGSEKEEAESSVPVEGMEDTLIQKGVRKDFE
jgi:hypothetical protein